MLRERLVIPYDEVELQHHHEEEASKYRDRAEERRRTENQNDKEFIDADGNKIKLGGLDFDLLNKSREEIARKEKEMAHLRAMKEKAQIQLKKFHESKIQHKKESEQKKQIHSIPLKLEPPKLLAPPQLAPQSDSDNDDNIFGDVPQELPQKANMKIEPSNFEYEKKSDFDIKAYAQRTSMRDVKEEENKKRQYEEEARVREKILRQQKMLQEQEDYYTECYQKVSKSFDDDRKQKEEQELAAQISKEDPKKASVHFRGQQKGQFKKKKKEDFNKQLDDIEQIIKKRRG